MYDRAGAALVTCAGELVTADNSNGPPRADVGAYILAGGASERMGRSKARLPLAGTPLARHLARALAPHVRTVTLVAKADQGLEDLGLPMLYDATAAAALVHGIRTVLVAPGPRWRFICACDMPEVGGDILARLWHAALQSGAPGSCLRRADRDTPEPVPSLWHAGVAASLSDAWGQRAWGWVRAAGLTECVATAAEARALTNLNTPEELRAYVARQPSEATGWPCEPPA